jgi:hypothetical protein
MMNWEEIILLSKKLWRAQEESFSKDSEDFYAFQFIS